MVLTVVFKGVKFLAISALVVPLRVLGNGTADPSLEIPMRDPHYEEV
jgi:hypothetical protein